MSFRWPSFRSTNAVEASAPRYRRSDDVSSASHGDRTVLLDLKSEQFFSLDEVGLKIWEAIGETRTIDQIVTGLSAEYEAPEADIRRDVEAFLHTMVKSRLVVEVR
jgi:hypothetical protein